MYLKTIRDQFNAGVRLKFLFFWGYTSSKQNSIDKSCLSQWYPSSFSSDSHSYHCAEQYMMAQKAGSFEDQLIFNKILNSRSAGEAKDLGRMVKKFDQKTWDESKYDFVVKANYLKFSQNKALAEFLINTQNRILVEASPLDKVWGIGLAISDERCQNPNLWKGQNLLGFALMDVRSILKKV